MGLFDNLMGQAEELAGKVGVSPDQVQSIANSIQANIGDGTDPAAALEKVAQEHGLPVETIQALIAHAGSAGDVESELGGLAGRFLKA